MANLRKAGNEAEDRAADFLLGLGYTLVTRRYTCKGGEIDIIALDDDVMVFVEVKARATSVAACEAIDDAKVRRMLTAASIFLIANGETERTVRYDLVAVCPDVIEHFPDFFRG